MLCFRPTSEHEAGARSSRGEGGLQVCLDSPGPRAAHTAGVAAQKSPLPCSVERGRGCLPVAIYLPPGHLRRSRPAVPEIHPPKAQRLTRGVGALAIKPGLSPTGAC